MLGCKMQLRDETELAVSGSCWPWDGGAGISHAVAPRNSPSLSSWFYFIILFNSEFSLLERLLMFCCLAFAVGIVLFICFIFSSLVFRGRF